MKGPVFFDGQDVLQDDLVELIDSLATETKLRFGQTVLGGIVVNMTLSPAGPNLVTVAAGTVMQVSGELIETEAVDLQVDQTDIGLPVVLHFLEDLKTVPVLHPVTGEPILSETQDSYEFSIGFVQDPDDIVVGTIVTVGLDGIVTVSTAGRQEFGLKVGAGRLDTDKLDPTGEVALHLAALGTGTLLTDVNPHRQALEDIGFRPDNTIPNHLKRSHRSHLRTDNPLSRAGFVAISGLTLTSVPAVSEEEEFVVDGVAFDAPQDPITPLLQGDGNVGYGGVLAVMLNSNGVLETKSILYYLFPRTITGVMPVDLDQTADFPSNPTTQMSFQVSAGVKQIRWMQGPWVSLSEPTDLLNGDAFYTLLGGIEAGVLTVWVDYSTLPAVPLTDTLRLEHYPDDNNDVRMRLGHLFYDRTGVSPILGYGNEGTGGQILDTRSIGSIALQHLDNDFKDLLRSVMSELRRDGFVQGGEISVAGLSYAMESAVVYVDGNRLILPASGILVFPVSVSRYLYIDQDGVLQVSTTDPADLGQPFAAVAYMTSDGGNIVYLRDDRTVLQDVDRMMKLGSDALSSADDQQLPRLRIDQGAYGSCRGFYRGRTLLIEAPGPSGFDKVRIYATHWSYFKGGQPTLPIERMVGIDVTFNARWLPDDEALPPDQQACWRVDDASRDAAVWGYDSSGWYQQLKRHEDLAGQDGTWLDNSVVFNSGEGGSAARRDWSNSPFQFDLDSVSISFHTTEFQNSQGLLDIKERIPIGTACSNAVVPQNLIRAWGLLEVSGTAINETEVEVKGAIRVGLNIGDPIYLDDGSNSNTWKIALRTRLLRINDPKYGLVPDGAVVSCDQSSGGQDGDDFLRPRVRLEDDGKTTYVIVRGPLIPADDTSPQRERSFSLNFIVVGTAADEALPPPEAIVGDGTHTITQPVTMGDWSRPNVPIKRPVVPFTVMTGVTDLGAALGSSGPFFGPGGVTGVPGGGVPISVDPGGGFQISVDPGVPPVSRPPMPPGSRDMQHNSYTTDDNSNDPYLGGRGPRLPGGGRGPNTGRGGRGG